MEAHDTSQAISLNNPITLIRDIASKYGPSWVEIVQPETLWSMIESDFGLKGFGDVSLYRDEKDLILAVRLAAVSDAPWVDFHVFEKVGQAFNGNHVNFSTSQPLSPGECLYTVSVLRQIRGKETFGIDVAKYVAVSFKDRGYTAILPGVGADFAQTELDLMDNDLALKSLTLRLWNKIVETKTDLMEVDLSGERAADIQIARLFTLSEYLKIKENKEQENKEQKTIGG